MKFIDIFHFINEIVSVLNKLISFHSNFIVLSHFVNTFFTEIEKNPESQDLISYISIYKSKWKNAGGISE